MIIDEKSKKEFIDGYFIYDGCFGFAEGRFGFVLQEDDKDKLKYRDTTPLTRFLYIKCNEPMEDRFYYNNYNGLGFSNINSSANLSDFIAVDTGGFVVSWENDEESEIDRKLPGTDRISSISKVVRVGESIYALGAWLRIYKRIGRDCWKNNFNTLPIPYLIIEHGHGGTYHFRDMAGFSECDMYAVGDKGSAYHFNGEKWNQISFPTNIRLTTVSCAGDDKVYITDKNCSVWVGRGSTWEMLIENDKSLSFFDSAWFDGRMWFANDYGIWIVENDQLVLAKDAQHKPIPEEIAILCGRIDVSPDNQRMLVCGQRGAAVFNGNTWEILFNCNPA